LTPPDTPRRQKWLRSKKLNHDLLTITTPKLVSVDPRRYLSRVL